ncbi:hypothetical protein L6R52_42705, partial [Myxococcota bacterium]|nr:hypothetical protein [Myxococcota bacterium]
MTDRVSLAGHDAAAAWTAFQRIAREHERESTRDERSSVERTFARAIETAEVAGEQESLSREIADQMKPIDSAIQLAGAAAAIAGGVVTVAAAAGGVVAMCTGVGAPIGVAVEAVAVGTAAGSALAAG